MAADVQTNQTRGSHRLACVVLNHKSLDPQRLEQIAACRFSEAADLDAIASATSLDVLELAVIEKCNGAIVAAVVPELLALELVRTRILEAWDRLSVGGIQSALSEMSTFADDAAFTFIAEAAMGLRSVVVGDSQVYAQVRDPLARALSVDGMGVLPAVARWLPSVRKRVTRETDLHSGQLSLERLACASVAENVATEGAVAVIGTGRAGRLIAEILTKEQQRRLVLVNRTQSSALSLAAELGPDFKGRPEDVRAVIVAVDGNDDAGAFVASQLRDLGALESGMYVVDLSVPDVVRALDVADGMLVPIDALREAALTVRSNRQQAISRAKQIVEQEVRSAGARLLSTQRTATGSFVHAKTDRVQSLARERAATLGGIRRSLDEARFIEVETPCVVGVCTDPPKVDDGGAFEVPWFGQHAFLRQSNQIYKQALIISGLERIYEIGRVWRREATPSPRHLDELTMLDVELQEPGSLRDLYILATRVVLDTAVRCEEVLCRQVRPTLPATADDVVVLSYQEAISILRGSGFSVHYGDDLGVAGEAFLGKVVKERFDADLFVITKYPDSVKKFYTWRNDDGTTDTFDMVFGGWEIMSGAMREVRRSEIERRMLIAAIDPGEYQSYLEMFEPEPVRHGGFGLGVDRLVSKLFERSSVAEANLYPRTLQLLLP